jgi:hypothetical protein
LTPPNVREAALRSVGVLTSIELQDPSGVEILNGPYTLEDVETAFQGMLWLSRVLMLRIAWLEAMTPLAVLERTAAVIIENESREHERTGIRTAAHTGPQDLVRPLSLAGLRSERDKDHQKDDYARCRRADCLAAAPGGNGPHRRTLYSWRHQ